MPRMTGAVLSSRRQNGGGGGGERNSGGGGLSLAMFLRPFDRLTGKVIEMCPEEALLGVRGDARPPLGGLIGCRFER